MRSAWSLGFVMIAVSGLSLFGFAPHARVATIAYVIAALLAVGGVALLATLPYAFYFALTGATVLALTGVLALAGHPELALPVPPVLSIVVGLYLGFRVALVKSSVDRHRQPSAAGGMTTPTDEPPTT